MRAQGPPELFGTGLLTGDLTGGELRGLPAGRPAVKAGLGRGWPWPRVLATVGKERLSEKSFSAVFEFQKMIKSAESRLFHN